MAVAGKIVLREHPAHGGLVLVRLHKVPPCPVPPQALDGGQVGPGAVLNGDGPLVEVPVLMVEGADLLFLHAGAEKAGGLAGQRQTLLLNCGDAVLSRPAPVHKSVDLRILLVGFVVLFSSVLSLLLAHVIADVLEHLLASGPHLPAGRVVVAELLLGSDFVLERAFL